MAEPLVSLTRFKSSLANVTDPSAPSPQDAQYSNAIMAASTLVRSYTSLRFDITDELAVSAPKDFEYDGSGFLDIYEAQTIESVSSRAGYEGATTWLMNPYQWGAYPLNSPVKFWLQLPQEFFGAGISPEMGFTYNLDTLYYKYQTRPMIVTVTAIWGWPDIPEDVQQATIWTATAITETSKPYTSESIEGFSRTRGSADDGEALPERAKAALAPYMIPRV